ncbi:MAG: peptidylprolyl isomerase [Rubrivivax sp.]|nr:peptidylprolyl isomerase [Rubrivivax sp.]MDP3086294.1 peptidylprolyl isomerase [Rubrivivax sp.]
MTELLSFQRSLVAIAAAFVLVCAADLAQAQARVPVRNGDYIAVVVNQELVTAGEVERRVAGTQQEAARSGAQLPSADALHQLVLDALIDERVIVTHARESGMKVDDGEIDRAVQNVAAQNQLTIPQLRERLRADGLDYTRFRAGLRDQMLIERVREREVYQRITISDADVDRFLDEQRRAASADAEISVAQILVTVPEGASAAVVAERRARAEAALARLRGGEAFERVAKEVSEDANRERGGELGMRPSSRLPDVFVEAVRGLSDGQLAPTLLRSGAGFHVLKLIERRDGSVARVTQTHARHILLRTSAQLSADAATRRLAEYRQQIESGARRFEDLARQVSEDGSAAEGGDLGWAAPGVMVPEFDEAMNQLQVGSLSPPVVSRFGVHLIQVLGRREVALDVKQQRDQARNVLREQKFEQAYSDWARDLRARAYIEKREPPL